MLRRITMVVVALAAAVGGYLWVSSDDTFSPRAPESRPDTATRAEPATRPLQRIRGGDRAVGAGDRPELNVIDPDTGQVRYRFSAESWNPTNDTTYDVRKPDIRIFMTEGEVTYITADAGEFEVAGTGRKDLDPKRGKLTGNVRVIVDRTTRVWRQDPANALRLERAQHPEYLVTITMPEARFDMEASRLTADGPVVVHGEEADVNAHAGADALTLTWNGIDNRVDYLALRYGGSMELRRDTGLANVRMPGANVEPAPAAAQKPSGAAAVESPGAATRPQKLMSGDEIIALLRRDIEAPRAVASAPAEIGELHGLPEDIAARLSISERQAAAAAIAAGQLTEDQLRDMARRRMAIVTYAATFHDQVTVEQTVADSSARPNGIDCNLLELIFEVGRARTSFSAPSSAQAPAASAPVESLDAPNAADPPQKPGGGSRVKVTWAGLLELRPLEGVSSAHRTGKRFDVIATGGPVKIRDAQGDGECERLVFRNESKSAWLIGTRAAPAYLRSSEGREMASTQIALDRDADRAKFFGPGLLRDPGRRAGWLNAAPAQDRMGFGAAGGGEEPVELQWTSGVDIDLARAELAEDTPQGPRMAMREYLSSARFRGGVHMSQGKRSLAGGDVYMIFGMPRKAGVMADHITRLELRDAATLSDDTRTISAASMDADMMLTRDGGNVPRHVEAAGKVSVTEGARRFAAEKMTVDFSTAAVESAGGGASPLGRSVARHIVANGRVFARDPQRRLELDADHFDATFDEAGALSVLKAVGPGDTGWAYAQTNDYAINGHHVTIDAAAQRVTVPARGQAVFVTQRDFDGRALDQSTTVSITFDAGMDLDGRKNLGEFNGAVHASTDTHDMTCDRKLTVRFEDAAGAASQPVRMSSGFLTMPGWMRTRWSGDAPAPDAAFGASLPISRTNKRPASVLSEGNAVALTTVADMTGRLQTRLRISGPVIDANLISNRMQVPGAGSLVIEDYRAPKSAGATRSTYSGSRPPLGSDGGNGPSQTVFYWTGGMTYEVKDARVVFDRAVQMVHLAGSQMVLQGELAAALGADVARLKQLPGRSALLDCQRLTAQFMSQSRAATQTGAPPQPARGGASPLDARWTEIRSLEAIGAILLREGARTLEGEALTFDGTSNTLTIKGRPGAHAEMLEQDEATQRVRSWKGPIITWNRATGSISAPGASISVR